MTLHIHPEFSWSDIFGRIIVVNTRIQSALLLSVDDVERGMAHVTAGVPLTNAWWGRIWGGSWFWTCVSLRLASRAPTGEASLGGKCGQKIHD